MLLSVWCAGLALSGCSSTPKESEIDDAAARAEEEALLSPWLSGARPKGDVRRSDAMGGAPDDAAIAMARAVMGGAVTNQPVSMNQREGLWSIVITVMRGDGAPQAAERARTALEVIGGIDDAYVEQRGDTYAVAYGRYKDPMTDEAQMDLVRIRATVIDGKQPYLGAALTPPPFESAGNIPQFNLSIAKDFPTNRNCIYTLQVAQYRRMDNVPPTIAEREEFRRAAEVAAVTLRREGEEAYYYHGPRMSVVTIGMFNDKEYRTQNARSANNPQATVMLTKPVESMEIKQLRERQPYNLVNGQAMKTKTKGSSTAQMQKCIMVEIPK